MGQIRCNLDDQDAGHRRFVSGLMSAAMVDPGLLDPIRAHQRRKFSTWQWTDDDLMRYLMLLAAEGVFWQEFFNLNPMPPEVPIASARYRAPRTAIRTLAQARRRRRRRITVSLSRDKKTTRIPHFAEEISHVTMPSFSLRAQISAPWSR